MLNIYRASAGAGKTHLLTGEYIKLLFRKDLLPEAADHETQFEEILAVTFTNKSTAEMKARIVKELNVLGEDPARSYYYKDIRTDGIDGVLTDEQIKSKAKFFLKRILNNYSDFAISTIDSFFQKIVRSFARELNLQCNYEVELNTNRILDTAVSNFLEKLDAPEHQALFEWMLKFSEKKIEEGSGWRLERDLQQLAKSVLTSEDFRTKSESIRKITEDKQILTTYIATLNQIILSTKSKIKALGEEGLRAIENGGLEITVFKGGSKGKMKIFESWKRGEIKEPDETIVQWAESDELWYSKTNKQRLDPTNTEKVKNLLCQAVDLKNESCFINYNTAKTILENIYQLGILADIDYEVNKLCNDEGVMLLSNTTEMLNKLIGEDSAPFIYEKTGTRISNFMIDEFQDTSRMQWDNFKPLIENSLANGRQNLIVGDVKQSIYRWRGSDWGLLHSGLNNFAHGSLKDDYSTLRTNYRSQKEIITFNNSFFKFISKVLSEHFKSLDIKEIYQDVAQEIPSKKDDDAPGLVDIKFLNVQDNEKFADLAMAQIPYAVMDLEDAGYRAKDIAILCRTKALCKKAADALLNFKSNNKGYDNYVFDIISSEALLLGSRHVIKTIISILRYIQNPKSHILRSIASCNYLHECRLSEVESVKTHFKGSQDIDKFLEFSNRPLYDMIEGIFSQIPSIHKDVAYIQAFRDCVLEFTNNKKSDITAFLEWWEQYGTELCINTPEGQNAIRIMTIHKSKGLGMPAVILPFCEGTTDISSRGSDILWCEPKTAPFYQEGLYLPIRCSKSLLNTIFSGDYERERLKAIIDNLNTIYVAFTRAKEAMVILSPLPPEKKKPEAQETLLFNFVNEQYKHDVSCIGKDTRCKIGKYERKKDFEKDDVSEFETIKQNGEGCFLRRKLPQLSLKHDKLTKDTEAIERGNCIHEALSVIIDYNNIDEPINELYLKGKIKEDFITCEEMKAEIHRLINNENVKKWFTPGLKVLNERTILAKNIQYDGKEKDLHRPDRIVIDGDTIIVIDYKTGEHLRKHYKQVGDYMSLLENMGFKKIEGYLWYTNPHQLVKVKNQGYKKAQ